MNSSSENTHEKETRTHAKKRKTSKLAIATVVLAVVPFYIWLLYALKAHVYPPGPSRMEILARNISGLVAIFALLVAVSVALKLRRSSKRPKGLSMAIVAIALSVMFLWFWVPEQILRDHPANRGNRVTSATNLKGLYNNMWIYANDNDGKFPTPDKWCDLLLDGDYVGLNSFVRRRLILYWPLVGGKMLVRPVPKRGRCDYAMNPNCDSISSPPDMVLLFESKSGWNQYGGPELLATEQWDGKGCNIAFNDGHVDFVRTEELGRLKWEKTRREENE
jgi:prepilin-type processing-associated H-X9-DG protein